MKILICTCEAIVDEYSSITSIFTCSNCGAIYAEAEAGEHLQEPSDANIEDSDAYALMCDCGGVDFTETPQALYKCADCGITYSKRDAGSNLAWTCL